MVEIRPVYWFLIGTGILIFITVLGYCSVGIIQRIRNRRKLLKWAKKTKSKTAVVVHIPPRAKTLPNASPYVMKVLTFLRMFEIPFEIDHEDPFGGKGKTPWISHMGCNVADSEFILDYLIKTFKIDINKHYNDEQLAVATAVRTMVDEHLSWALAMERFVYGETESLLRVIQIPKAFLWIIRRVVKSRALDQGIGHHSYPDIVQIMTKDFRVISQVLGKKKFICGAYPCAEDAGIFGHLAQWYWGAPGSPYEKHLHGPTMILLKSYCNRIRDHYWPDWEDKF